MLTGIPDYRSEGVGLYARSNARPVQHLEFIQSPKVRHRYWARNFVAWPHFSNIQPNATHKSLARLEHKGQITSLVTQNVDRLHTKAGSKNVLELHGCGYKVICLGSHCDYSIDRHELQLIFNSMNQIFLEQVDMERPDGDVDIPQVRVTLFKCQIANYSLIFYVFQQEYIDSFKVPDCPKCGGMLKPEIVFFGDNVPKHRAEKLANWVCNSDALMILGSSLLVYSGYRILLHYHDLGTPIAIVNIGKVRGEERAQLKISAKCGDIIPKLFLN